MTLEATLVRIADALEKANELAGGAAAGKTETKPRGGNKPGKPAADPVENLDDELGGGDGLGDDDLNDDLGGDGLDDDPVVITKADMRAAVVAYKDATSREKAQELLKKYKATSVDTVAEADYAKLVETAVKLTLAANKAKK